MSQDKGYDENQKFDEFEGNDVGLFASPEYDEQDKEADVVWVEIDKRTRVINLCNLLLPPTIILLLLE
ncbi:protein stabilized1 [Tanacetum coccineum]